MRRDLGPPRDSIATQLAVSGAEAALFGGPRKPVLVDRFELRERIGIGGQGVVYAARDTRLDREVALKLVRPGTDVQTKAKTDDGDRLLREAQAMAKLTHPNVVTVFDAGPYAGGVYLAMELVEGQSLSEWLRDTGRPWPQTLRTLLDAGRGLAAAHEAGLVHRDFKPTNVLVRSDGHVLVSDFGLATDTGGADPTWAGTPRYMAPEQHARSQADTAADQFAFCVTAYEALYRQSPRLPGDALRPPPRTGLVPRRIFDVLARGMATAPDERWPDLQRLLAALQHDPRRRRHRLLIVAAISTLVGIVLIGALFQGLVYFDYLQARP